MHDIANDSNNYLCMLERYEAPGNAKLEINCPQDEAIQCRCDYELLCFLYWQFTS